MKYPRTFHLPSSPGSTSDDKVLMNINHLLGKDVVISVKMDGENTTLNRDHCHARSLDSRHHPSRNWIKKFHSEVSYKIPEGWRICGENLYAKHSIEYTNLKSYFYGFSIWNEKNEALSWDETLLFFSEVGICSVDVLFRGTLSEKVLSDIIASMDTSEVEGFVVRLADSFHYDHFKCSVAKWVRANHVQTDEHWMHSGMFVNQLKGNS